MPIPVYRYYRGLLSCVFNATSVKQAQVRHMGTVVPAREMALLDSIASWNWRRARIFASAWRALEPGDIQLLNNYTVVHWRRIRDFQEEGRKRLLYRL